MRRSFAFVGAFSRGHSPNLAIEAAIERRAPPKRSSHSYHWSTLACVGRHPVYAWIGSCKSDQSSRDGGAAARDQPTTAHIGMATHMLEQLLDSLRRASQSTIQGQQQLFNQWLQQWPGASAVGSGQPTEWPQTLQKQWLESLGETLNRQRELLDSSYRKGAQLIEQASRVSDVKSPEDYRRLAEELWRSFSETLKDQAEANVRDFQRAAQRWVDIAPQGVAPQSASSEKH